jgi:hypothetical protein
MKRALLFLMLAGGGFWLLLSLAGGLSGPGRETARPEMRRVEEPEVDRGHRIDPGGGLPFVDEVLRITQMAPPRPIIWKDKLTGESIQISGFLPWKFQAGEVKGIRPADADQQGVLCTKVFFTMFREPLSRAEALALERSEKDAYEALRHQEFSANEAVVYGRLADKLQRRGSTKNAHHDTMIRLTGDVRIQDFTQGMEMQGEAMTVWPDQERGESRTPFTVRHEAFVLEGNGLTMEREKERGWSRLSILSDPVLRIVSDVKGRDGRPVFDFGPGDFRPARVASSGRAILVREDRRRETLINVTFTDKVGAEQSGGRRLDADRVEMVAARTVAGTRVGAKDEGNWRLRRFQADGAVAVEYPNQTSDGRSYIASMTADRLIHDVPVEGEPHTVLEGDPVILMRGEVPLLGPGGRLRASCRRRASIGPVPAALATDGLPTAGLQHIALRGQARVERRDMKGGGHGEDVLEGDEIDLVLMPAPESDTRGSGGSGDMIATYFAALGDVRLGGTRIVGSTTRLVGEDLHTEHPHVFAQGPDSRFSFPNLGAEQRLLGPDASEESSRAPSGAAGTGPREAGGTDDARGRWQLHRLRALGMVSLETTMGGPAVGIPAHVEGHEVTYDRISSRAQVREREGARARIAWGDHPDRMNVIETPTLTLERAKGVVTAEGGVHGDLHVARKTDGDGTLTTGGSTHGSRGTRAPATLEIRTDARIDIDLVSLRARLRPQVGAEQRIRIGGPVVAELRTSRHMADRMKAQSLEVALVYGVEPEPPRSATAPSARAGSPRSEPTPATRPAREEGTFEQFEVDARTMRAQLVDGSVRRVELVGDVDMRGKDRAGRLTGERVTYDATTHEAHVFASTPDWRRRPAVVWMGDSAQRTEVEAVELSVRWANGVATRIEARSPSADPATIQLYRRDPADPQQLEWYKLTYWGLVKMRSERLEAGRVVVVRRLREDGQDWGAPTALWAPSLSVIGVNMLSADERERDMRRIVAEGPDTSLRSGSGADLLHVWGHRFDFDVRTKKATLTGLPEQDVVFHHGKVRQWASQVVLDMKTNIPTFLRGVRVRRAR